ncbi:MAG: PAS domain S-box protein, partial [Candidatus Aminicenantes bacterium]|nr:PAS domain S-box protein [Candidatus Aminicenantes bacterium]
MRPDTRKKLRAGYPLILLFAVLAAGIITTGYLSYRNYERQFRIETERQLSAIADLKVNELEQWRKERLGDAGILFKNASFSALVRNFFRRPADSESRGQLQVWLDNYRTHYEYDRIFLLDAQCVERMSAPQTPEPVAAHLLEQAPEILRSDRVTFLDFHRDSPDRPIHLSILIPILDGRDDRPALGILVLRIDPGKYLYPYISRWPAPSRSAETLLVRRDGNDALYLNELKFQKNTALNLRVPLTAIDVPTVKAALGREGIAEGVDYRGVRVAACVRAVPDSPWFLVARMDTAEAYAPARERLWVTVGLVGALFLGAGAGVGLIWRHQRARFYRELYRTAEARRESEAKLNALFEILPVGVSILDAERKISFMNSALERILEMSREGLLRGDFKSRTYLRPDGTPMPAEEFASVRALEEQRAIHNVETGAMKENGTIIWTSVSAVPVPFPDWKVVIVTSDITERKRAEEELRRNEIRLKGILEATADGILAVDHRGKIINVNRRFAEMWRIPPELMERGDDDALLAYVFDQLADPEAFMAKVRELYGSDKEETSVILFKDERVFERFSSPLILKGSIVGRIWSFRDITGRKRAEDALRQAEENFRRSLDDSPLGVRIVNAEGETLYANRAILDIYGYDSIEELRATPLEDRYTPESYEEFQLRKEKRRQGEDGPSEYQISIVKKNGEIRRVQVFRKEVLWNGARRFQTL